MTLKLAIAIFAIIGALALSYLFTTGIVWLILVLVNKTFNTAYNPNIWTLGLLAWVAMLAFNVLSK